MASAMPPERDWEAVRGRVGTAADTARARAAGTLKDRGEGGWWFVVWSRRGEGKKLEELLGYLGGVGVVGRLGWGGVGGGGLELFWVYWCGYYGVGCVDVLGGLGGVCGWGCGV